MFAAINPHGTADRTECIDVCTNTITLEWKAAVEITLTHSSQVWIGMDSSGSPRRYYHTVGLD